MSRVFVPLSCVLCVLLLGTAGNAWAQQRDRGPQQAPRAQQSGDLSDSVRRIERRTGGQVLSAEQIPFDGRNVNRIKVVDDRGRVRVFTDDPAQARQRGGQRPEPRSGSRRDDD